jgi:alkanesulfonate monooxygenase SsuD/methylene tetrahydromethanopterin reductase-like flavin-dependent oxidoreductase (luciferase family)
MICEMAGCHDAATHTADFWQYSESFEICGSCAGYWSKNQDEKPKIKKLNEGKTKMNIYKVQRPTTIWVQAIVRATNLDQALEIADEVFIAGEFTELDDTFTVNYDRYWVQKNDNDELIFTESHAPIANA